MSHWPKSIIGNVFAFLLIAVVGLAGVQSAVALSGPFIWMGLFVVTLVSFAAFVWYRRAQAASDLALADAPSFGDVLPHWNHPSDLDPPTPAE